MEERTFVVAGGEPRVRLDRYLVGQFAEYSRTQLQRLIENGQVRVDGIAARPGQRIEPGQRITLALAPRAVGGLLAEQIEAPILYEDADVIVVDKPAGMVVHPGHGATGGTLVNALVARYPELREFDDPVRPGIVHRLDKDTSGVMVVARSPAARRHLQAQFAARTVYKAYWALVHGQPTLDEALIEAAVGRSRTDPARMAIAGRAERPARTAFRIIERFDRFTLVEARPITGRTHQIRLHFAALGHPIAGDRTYGSRTDAPGLNRQFLHARLLRFILPSTGTEREFASDLPRDLSEVLTGLRGERHSAS